MEIHPNGENTRRHFSDFQFRSVVLSPDNFISGLSALTKYDELIMFMIELIPQALDVETAAQVADYCPLQRGVLEDQ